MSNEMCFDEGCLHGAHNEPIPQIEYMTAREAEAALEGFAKGKREGSRLAREQIAQEIEAKREKFVRYSKAKPLVDQLADASGIACFDLAAAIARGKTE